MGNDNLIKRVEILERALQVKRASSEDDVLQPKIVRDKNTDAIKLEDTLIDYMEIIVNMNAKLNNHIQSTKIAT